MIRSLTALFLLAATPALGAAQAPVVAAPGMGMVSAADPRAAEAGRAILRAGGSAADAEVAMIFALTVVEPQSSGIGGGGYFVHRDARTGRTETIDGREIAPAAARGDRFLGPDGAPMPFAQAFPGGRSVGVPGNVRLAALAHKKWGKLPWARLIEPAIRLAEQGYEVTPLMASRIAAMAPLWKDFPAIAALYTDQGRPKPAGAMIRNPALATLLRRIAAEGPDAFYAGANAEAIATAVRTAPRNPVPFETADLARYAAREQPPVCGAYRGYRVCGMAPSSAGGVSILQMLAMLSHFDMKALGKDSPEAWHLIGEAMQLAYADRDQYLGDTAFVDVPLKGLLDPAYLARRAALIAPTRALGRYPPGTPPGAAARTAGLGVDEHGTTDFVAADGAGDIVTMTSTVEGYFGSQLIANGMVLNNELTDFSFAPEKEGAPVANRVAPGKRPLSSMSPTIVTDAQGRVVLAIGSAGGRRIVMHVLKALVGVLDWGLSAQEAIDLPNIFYGGGALLIEDTPQGRALAPQLARFGQPANAVPLPSKLNAIERLPDGRWRGAADHLRSEGVVLAQ
ncbi:gamma-glutamyltransferase [Sphingomonas morindae]|uniref:Glutathione hydrolase proenzyme n=1 Tax=Sphingomonas morindae TaxID=1541170 RepID=A0ABY4XBL7_9SPHN|nr:gamma-glutamyltransferase [Sphingomonas morindae]USI74372.1 gamma-glutamyltransferase [Sphingomonas morindae]